MKIRRLTICAWTGGNGTDTAIDTPSWPDIESAVRALNNRELNDIHMELEAITETFLSIGGGGRWRHAMRRSCNAGLTPEAVTRSNATSCFKMMSLRGSSFSSPAFGWAFGSASWAASADNNERTLPELRGVRGRGCSGEIFDGARRARARWLRARCLRLGLARASPPS